MISGNEFPSAFIRFPSSQSFAVTSRRAKSARFPCGIRIADCGTGREATEHPQITLIAQISFLPSASSAKSADKTSP
jgi:hypothetical protein